MPYTGLSDFITRLDTRGGLLRIKAFFDPLLEISEVADRFSKNGGKALLFENNGTSFPLLINAFGSDERMALALSRTSLEDTARDIENTFASLVNQKLSLRSKIGSLPSLLRLAGYLPSRKRGKGLCQQVIYHQPDLSMFPVLKCWPHDGGRYITLPMVHTKNPVTGKTNVGMYRMQILDNKTTAMHWQRHKTGANHFEEYRKKKLRMPVTVTLGGDPVYAYAATAPLPENIDEYILAGFLRKKRVRLVKCITNDLLIPADADIVIEGYVDPEEDPVLEGPFGDHTGFYSLAALYPKFHVTCITHSSKAVYTATIVGIPPMEDEWLAMATEKIFLSPLRLAILPEIEDMHMPAPGVAHNLVIVKIRKTYPGQGKKVISSLMGAGQMMFTKYMIVVSGETHIRNYSRLTSDVMRNTCFTSDLLFMTGPLDILDHTSEIPALGGKLGIDATEKLPEEIQQEMKGDPGYEDSIVVVPVNLSLDKNAVENAIRDITGRYGDGHKRLCLLVDHSVDRSGMYLIAWQVLGNSDPGRDIKLVTDNTIVIDGTAKVLRKGGFSRQWPNVVCSSDETISAINGKWESSGLGAFIPSPSVKYSRMLFTGKDFADIKS